jgi:hypothetical protein
MSERRYNEDEVAAIFERAADDRQSVRRQAAPGTGMTLAELQEIGREVGISPEAVAHAAGLIDHVAQPLSRAWLGLPIGVGRTIDLRRWLTQSEWERLVVDLRETFDARGTVRADGSFRQWTNGNLQALLEPTPSGHRLRLQTVKGSARAMITAGLGTIAIAAVTLIATALSGGLGDAGAVTGIATLSGAGLLLTGVGALRLPGWARLRAVQMEGIIARLAGSTPMPSSPAPQIENQPDPRTS